MKVREAIEILSKLNQDGEIIPQVVDSKGNGWIMGIKIGPTVGKSDWIGACISFSHPGLDPLPDVSFEITPMSDLVTELTNALKAVLPLVGYASCHGDKCRLPHCHDCNVNPVDIDEILENASEVLKKVSDK